MEKILEKSGKSQGILSVRKSGNPVVEEVSYMMLGSLCWRCQYLSFRLSVLHFVIILRYRCHDDDNSKDWCKELDAAAAVHVKQVEREAGRAETSGLFAGVWIIHL